LRACKIKRLFGVGTVAVKYQQEFLDSVVEDVKELLESHWDEVALNKDKIKINPDWDTYYALQEQGKLDIFTARDKGVLVGYFVVLVSTHMHYKDHLFAKNDLIYLAPSHRKGFTGVKLIKFAESMLKEDGVSVLVINTKNHKPFHKLMKFLGFSSAETLYSKYIGD
jgi:GNAT superfamily N-acetyltransferase